MKRKSIFILVSILLVLMLSITLLAGCSSNELTSPRDLRVQNGKFTWTKVSGADGYMVYFNDSVNNRFFTWTNSLDVDNENIKTSLISGQTNYLWVRAVKLDEYGEPSVLSDRSRLDFNYSRQLDMVTNVKAKDDSKIEFRLVDNATSYVALVKTDGGEAKEYEISYTVATSTTATINGLKQGTYKVSLVARAEGYKDSDPSEEIDFVQVEDDGTVKPTSGWTVTFDLNYEGSTPIIATAEDNRAVARPKDPERKGFTFKGWYHDSYCMKEADFSSKFSQEDITANTTFYAKWEEDAPVVIETTSIYAYFADWTEVSALIYEGDTALFEGDGLVMTAVDGKQGWFTAKVDNRTNKIVFTNGTEQTEEYAFDKSKPYYANGEFTATEPEIKIDDPTGYGVTVTVNETTTIRLQKNESPDDANVILEYFGTFDLTIGDSIKVEDSDGFEFINYEPECGFTGVATVTGSYTIYAKKYADGGNSIWMVVPEDTGGDVGETITLYYYNINKWTNLKAYAWLGEGNPNNAPWPGVAMTAVDGHDNWYQIEVSSIFTKVIFNGSGGQTADLTVNKSNVYFNGVEWTNDFTPYEGKTTKTVYFYNDKGWTNVYCYAWSGNVNNGAWPGVVMTAVQGHSGWYQIEISISLVSIIFDNGSGGTGNQTEDIPIPAGNEIYYKSGWVDSFN